MATKHTCTMFCDAAALCPAVSCCCPGADNANPPANRAAGAAAATQQHRDHLELQAAWSKFLKLFLQTAAEVSKQLCMSDGCPCDIIHVTG